MARQLGGVPLDSSLGIEKQKSALGHAYYSGNADIVKELLMLVVLDILASESLNACVSD